MEHLLTNAGVTVTGDAAFVTIITPGIDEPMSITLPKAIALALAKELVRASSSTRSELLELAGEIDHIALNTFDPEESTGCRCPECEDDGREAAGYFYEEG